VHHGFDRNKITVIENSVDTDTYKPAPGVKKDENLILYAGRLKKYKNVSALLTAVKMLRDSNLSVRLAIAGSGDDEARLRAQTEELGLSEHVQFMGFVDREVQVDLYRRAVVYVNPSLKEGWGITNIEANACGTAVVANDAPGLRDSVIHEKTGLLYRTDNVESMVDAIKSLITTPRKRKQLEKGGREWAQTFSWDSSARKVEEWLKRIPGENAR
jgi:glycosyltransferase involved in cell wall biosynthesis